MLDSIYQDQAWSLADFDGKFRFYVIRNNDTKVREFNFI